MPQGTCRICSKEFYVKPSHLKRGWGKYCSIECRTKSQLKGEFKDCFICSNQTWRTPRELKKSRSGKFFCNKSCQTIWRNRRYSGPKHPNWRGGLAIEYRKKLLQSKIKPICKACAVKDKRILIVHHKDKNHRNHNINNLIWLCLNCHYLVHKHNEQLD